MLDGWQLLLDIVLTLTAALVLGIVLEKLRMNAIVGYLIAGIVIGPGVAGWIHSGVALVGLSEVGIALLLFTIGLEFSLRELRRVGMRSFLAGALQVVVTTLVAAGIAAALGLPGPAAFTVGMCVALSSTAIVLRILQDRFDLETLHGRASLGILLAQDLAVLPMVLIVAALGSASGPGAIWLEMGSSLAKATALLAAMLLLVGLLLPRLVNASGFAKNREMPAILAIVCCAAAAWAAHAVGLSPSMGAFIAGLMLGESRFANQIRADVLPFRAVFLTLFFATVGMLLDVRWVLANWPLVLACAAAIVGGKIVLTSLVLRPLNPSLEATLAASIALCQVGEFSFILTRVGQDANVLDERTTQLLVGITVLLMLVSPPIVVKAPRMARWLVPRLPKRLRSRPEPAEQRPVLAKGHFIVIGYGDAGRAAALALRNDRCDVIVLDIDGRYVRLARQRGYIALVGDATQQENLHRAQIESACCVVVCVPSDRTNAAIVTQCKTLAPFVPVVTRARYHLYAEMLHDLGAEGVVDEEITVGNVLAEHAARAARPRAVESSR